MFNKVPDLTSNWCHSFVGTACKIKDGVATVKDQTKGEKIMKKAKFQLTIDVEYNLNDATTKDLKSILLALPNYLADRGMLSGETSAEVEKWDASVKLLKETLKISKNNH